MLKIESVVLKSLVSVTCHSGDGISCQRCGELHFKTDDDFTLDSSSCPFCRRFHICGDFVAMFSFSLGIRTSLRNKTISIQFFGALLVSREVNLCTFKKSIISDEDLPNEPPIQERVSQNSPSSKYSFSIEFLPSINSGFKSAITINVLRQPLEKSLSLTSEVISFSKGFENISFNLKNLQLLSGHAANTSIVSQEFTVEYLKIGTTLTDEKVDASLTLRGVFVGVVQDPGEAVFFQNLHDTVRSIGRSHSWLSPSEKPALNSVTTGQKSLEEKAIHVSINLETSPQKQDSAIRLVFIPDVTTPALVQLIRMAKLDASLPSSASESFNFVFETNSFSLDAILPKFCQIDSYLIQDEKAYSFSSSPISNLFVRSFGHEEKSRLFGISQFSAWCHADVIGFRISDINVEMPSLLLASVHSHLQNANHTGLFGFGMSRRGNRRSGRFMRRWFSAAAVTSLNRFTLDGHFETLRTIFITSCGARIECGLTRAHCSASPLPHFSPSRTPFSAPSMQQQSSISASASPPPVFLEFTISNSEFQLVIPDSSTSFASSSRVLTMPAFQSVEVSICESVDFQLDPVAHLCILEFLLLTGKLLQRRPTMETVDFSRPAASTVTSPWSLDAHNTSVTRLAYQSGNHTISVIFHGADIYLASAVSNRHRPTQRLKSPKIAVICDGKEIALMQNFILRKLPNSDAHRKVAFQLTTPANECLHFQMETLHFTFPFNYEFHKCFEEFFNLKRAIAYSKSKRSPYFAEVKAMSSQSDVKTTSLSDCLPLDMVFHVKKFTLEIKDDPFECKLSDDFMVLMDESVEQQKRVAALTAQLECNRQSRGVPIFPADAAAELQTCLKQLKFQRAAEYIARIRRFYSGYKMADDLFTWSMETTCLHVLSDGAYNSPERVTEEIKRMDNVSPWNDLQPSDFSQICCRRIHLTVGRFQWQLRDYSKNLIDAAEVTLMGPLAMATRRSDDPRGQRDCQAYLGPPWEPATVQIVRYIAPTKFFYELVADIKDLSLCYGSNWEPTVAWLNLRLDDIKRASVDPSTPPLGWWDKVRLNLHGRLGFSCRRFSWLYSTSSDPYNAREFLTYQWTNCSFDWIPGRIIIHGDLDLFFETASKYDGICHVLQIPGLNFEVSMDWLSFGDQFDHHSVMVVNGERLKPEELPHDSYMSFRGNRLLLGLSFSVNEVSSGQRPRCFVYTNLIKLFDRLKSCITRISRPIRRGAVFNRIRPRKPLFGRLIQSLELSFRIPCLEVTYWVSYTKRLGIHACSGPLDLRCVFGVHVEGEREARTSTNAVVYILPSRTSRRWIAPQWSLRMVDALLLNGRSWLLNQPDRTALHLISEAESNTSEQEGLPLSFSPNSELLIFSSIRFKRELRSSFDLSQQLVRVRIPGLESFNEGSEEEYVALESEEAKSSFHEETSSASPERRRAAKIRLSHEDLEPVHRVTVENPKMRWNETNRNLVYAMMNMYRHAQTLKKNLSAQALKGISLDITNNSAAPQPNELTCNKGDGASASSQEQNAHPSKASAGVDASTLTGEEEEEEEGKAPDNSPTASLANAPSFPEVPMLARLVKEAETAKFYAYCEEEPKQPDVLNQLQGLTLCTSTPVLSRQWHIELINCQVMLKPVEGSGGYIIVSAAKARLDSVDHPPVWRDARLLSKSSLIGHMECMQYYATVGGLEATTPDQWLSPVDVRDWLRLGAEFGQDALSGRPEVVGSGHAVGGVVSGAAPTNSTDGTIQLQRMISRCACQFVHVNYVPLDPNSLPEGQFVPPLPPTDDDSKILQSQEGADTFTLLHRTLNLSTNSLQYSMIFDVVNNLLLYVEPQQKERFERNRVGLSLLGERELRQTILRDQETLRGMVNAQRVQERELWAALRQFDRNLRAAGVSTLASGGAAALPIPPPRSGAGIDSANSPRMSPAIAAQAEQILAFEEKINQLKTSIVEKNSLLSQSIAHFHKVHVQSQRLQDGLQGFGLVNPSTDASSVTPSVRIQQEQAQVSRIDVNGSSELRLASQTTFSPSKISVLQSPNGAPILPMGTPSPSASTVPSFGSAASVSVSGGGVESQSVDATGAEVEAEVVRRDEVCFEHARWRMTEADGQIGLADVELRGFLYARTHRRDDSGSHWLQLGSMRVRSLAPNSFYKEVLLPDCNSSYHHTGGPMIRVACTERPPVGGISVKEVMEISIAPLILQISKPFYNQLMPFFFPERGNEETTGFASADNAESLDPGGNDLLTASSEDLVLEAAESRGKKRGRHAGKFISRLDPKSWSGRFKIHLNRQQPRLKAVIEESPVDEAPSAANQMVEPGEHGGSVGSSVDPALSLLPLDVMRERARRNQVFLYIKIPGFPIRLSYKGDKQKNLADVTNFELNIPMLEYHNRLWTWLDFVIEVKMRIRRQLIKEVIKQKLRPRRAISWHTGGHSSSADRVAAAVVAAEDEDEASIESSRFRSSNNSSVVVDAVVSSTISSTSGSNTTAAAAAAESSRREQELLELILGRHAAEHPPQPSVRKKFRVFR